MVSYAPNVHTKKRKPPSPSAEKCMKESRRIHAVPVPTGTRAVFRDNDNAISDDFAISLLAMVLSLSIYCTLKGEGGGVLPAYEGQGSFVDLPGYAEPQFVTAAHNKMSDANTFEDGSIQQYSCRSHLLETASNKDDYIGIPNTGLQKKDAVPHFLRDGAHWNHGIDVSIGPVISRVELHVNRFLAVANDFKYEVGMKIGIVTLSTIGASMEDALVEKEEGDLVEGIELSDIYGEPNEVNIYTGEITGVGEDYFEHNINTFPGLSGAIVFLLDQEQPEYVSREDYKKAIGVHVGHKAVLKQNIAFKLAVETSVETPIKQQQKSWWQKCFGCLRSRTRSKARFDGNVLGKYLGRRTAK